MANECGTCTLCCKLIGVEELNKYPGKWCKHCTPGKGCNIYTDRPQSCRNFECGYISAGNLPSNLSVNYRPDHCHFIITGESKELDATIIHVDPNYPNAMKSHEGKHILQSLANIKHSVIIVTGSKRTLQTNSISTTKKIQAMLAQKEGVKFK